MSRHVFIFTSCLSVFMVLIANSVQAQQAPFGSGNFSSYVDVYLDDNFIENYFDVQVVNGTELDDTITIYDADDGFIISMNGRRVNATDVVGPDSSNPSGSYQVLKVRGRGGNDRIVYASDKEFAFPNSTPLRSRFGVFILGGDGDDFIRVSGEALVVAQGDAGDDTLSAGPLGTRGVSSLYGGPGKDLMYSGEGGHTLYGGPDNDMIFAGTGCSFLDGGEGDDELYGGPGNDFLKGGPGNDYINGAAGEDELEGNEGDDEIRGGLDADLISGHEGADQLYGGGGDDGVLGGPGDDSLYGGIGDDSIIGGPGIDAISPGAGNDHYEQEEGDLQSIAPYCSGSVSIFVDFGRFPGPSVTYIRGTEARDHCVVYEQSDGTTVILLNGKRHYHLTDEFEFEGFGADDQFYFYLPGSVFSAVRAQGGSGNDTLSIGNFSDPRIADLDGGPGDDILRGGGTRVFASLSGGTGDDRIFGCKTTRNIITADGGNNYILGGTANDSITCGAGDDIIHASDGVDTIFSGLGSDYVSGGAGDDFIDTGVLASSNGDPLVGQDGGDDVNGGSGIDVITTGGGNDFVVGGDGNDTIDGGAGNDEINGAAGSDLIDGGDGNDVLLGSLGDDTINGGTGDDTICGNQGSDTLDGGTGTNTVKQ
jgi:Ca2+-binding RTX toxin-like protein